MIAGLFNPDMRRKVGRNDPCPCGSGKKFKKCCLRKEIIIKIETEMEITPGKVIQTSVKPDNPTLFSDLPNVYFTPYALDWMKVYRIAPRTVADIIKAKESFQVLRDQAGIEVVIFLRHRQRNALPMLVTTSHRDTAMSVNSAFLIPENVMYDTREATPLEVLEALTNKFGAEISLGGESGKLIVSRRVLVTPDVDEIAIYKSDQIEYPGPEMCATLTKYECYGDTYIDCILAFVINSAKYMQAIGLPLTI